MRFVRRILKDQMADAKSSIPDVISVFNNKGGVGKTTLTFHLGHALAEMGHKTLFVDLDPQCNLTIYNLSMEDIETLWREEDPFIDKGFDDARAAMTSEQFQKHNERSRSVHYLLRPTEEGTAELQTLPPPVKISKNLALVPGRLTLHMYEEKVASRWSDLYRGDSLAIRTATRIRAIIEEYARNYGYEIIIVDTSPSLGALNKLAISTVDSFLIPCSPDLFSLYGIRNIGRALEDWANQFKILGNLLTPEKLKMFPKRTVGFLGFTIFNARRYAGKPPWDLALAHYNYAQQIPETIADSVPATVLKGLGKKELREPIGKTAVMHSHNTLPSMAQKYRVPIWRVPSVELEDEDRGTVSGNRARYEETKQGYHQFAKAVLKRMELVKAAHHDVDDDNN